MDADQPRSHVSFMSIRLSRSVSALRDRSPFRPPRLPDTMPRYGRNLTSVAIPSFHSRGHAQPLLTWPCRSNVADPAFNGNVFSASDLWSVRCSTTGQEVFSGGKTRIAIDSKAVEGLPRPVLCVHKRPELQSPSFREGCHLFAYDTVPRVLVGILPVLGVVPAHEDTGRSP